MLEEFKKFLLRGNVIDLATGVIIGAAFAKVVEGFTTGFVTPILRLFGSNEVGLKVGIFDLGAVISPLINFVITAAVVFFLIIKPLNTLAAKAVKKDAPPPTGPTTEELLTQIRDSLRK